MPHLTEPEWKEYQELRLQIIPTTKTWTDIIRKCIPEARLFPGATSEDFKSVERALGHPLPKDLQALLAETNGVDSDCGVWPVLPTNEIIKMNMEFRDPQFLADLSMPFDHLFFFGGLEDPFAFPRLKNGQFDAYVFRWDHETDARENWAIGLRDYLMLFTVLYHRPMMKNR